MKNNFASFISDMNSDAQPKKTKKNGNKSVGKATKEKVANNASSTSKRAVRKPNDIDVELPVTLFYSTERYLIDEAFMGEAFFETDEAKKDGFKVTSLHILNRLKDVKGYRHLNAKACRFEYNKTDGILGMAYSAGSKGSESTLISSETQLAKNPFFFYVIDVCKEKLVDFRMKTKKIPLKVIKPFLEHACNLATVQKECFAVLFYDNKEDKYILDIPPQVASAIRVDYHIPKKYDNMLRYTLIMDLHSHHVMNTSFSPEDDKEDNAPILHFLVHSIDTDNKGEFDLRLGVGAPMNFVYPKLSSVFSLEGEV